MIPSITVNPNNPVRIHPAGELPNMKFNIAPVRIIKLFENTVITVLSISKSNFLNNTLSLLHRLLRDFQRFPLLHPVVSLDCLRSKISRNST